MNLSELLTLAVERKASDLHLVASYNPVLRIAGELHQLATLPIVSISDIEGMIYEILSPAQKELLISNKELDFSVVAALGKTGGEMRFRANAYYQKTALSASFRLIPTKIATLEDLRLPTILHEFTRLKQGFILITGASGQGKSTTLASLINEINQNRTTHVITIEDPVEYVYPKGRSIISQREMYQDTHSWTSALKSVLREDPDIVYIGEMRDYETVSSALTIAETGHLVFSTLHTNSASQAIDRIIDIFPSAAREQVRLQLSMVISGIVTQRLIPSMSLGRIAACEVLLGIPSIKNVIREGKTHLIDNIIQTSTEEGMMLFEQHLKELVQGNIISHEMALEYALRPDRYLQLIGQT